MIENERIQQANLATNKRIQQAKQRSGDWKLETEEAETVTVSNYKLKIYDIYS